MVSPKRWQIEAPSQVQTWVLRLCCSRVADGQSLFSPWKNRDINAFGCYRRPTPSQGQRDATFNCFWIKLVSRKTTEGSLIYSLWSSKKSFLLASAHFQEDKQVSVISVNNITPLLCRSRGNVMEPLGLEDQWNPGFDVSSAFLWWSKRVND